MAKHKRRIKLIKPRLQVQLTLIFVGLSALGLFMQFMLFMATLSEVSLTLPNDGDRLMEGMNATLFYVIGMSSLVILPLTFVVGILTTFRIAGPLYHVEMHLKQIIRGEDPGTCTIRKGDKLHDFVDILNEAVDVLQTRNRQDTHVDAEREPQEQAA